jgi:hypothetical protein
MKMRPFQTIAQIIIATSLVNCAPAAVRPGPSGLGQSVAGRSGVFRRTEPFLMRKLNGLPDQAPKASPGFLGFDRGKLGSWLSSDKTPDTSTPKDPTSDKTPDTSTPNDPNPKAPEASAPPNPVKEETLKDHKGKRPPFDSTLRTGFGLMAAAGITAPVVYHLTKHKQYVRSFPTLSLLPCQYF